VGPILRAATEEALIELAGELQGEVAAVLSDLALEVAEDSQNVFSNISFIAEAGPMGGGQYDAGIGFYADACHRVLGLPARLEGLREVTRSAGLFWPFLNSVTFAERPIRLHRQGRRLHCTDGPAVEWPDDYAVYALNGTLVPRQVVESPESLSAKAVIYERRPAVRRLMIERMGVALVIQRAEAEHVLTVLDVQGTRGCPDYKRLSRLFFPGSEEPLVVLECTDATPGPDGTYQRYWLRVPPGMRTCLEAVAWTFSVTPEQYMRMALET
jgi:hypothetical protein